MSRNVLFVLIDMKPYIYFLFLFLVLTVECYRSPFRKEDPLMPRLISRSQQHPEKQFVYRDWSYYRSPIFTTFSENYLFTHMVQENSLTDRVTTKLLLSHKAANAMLEEVIAEVYEEKNIYTHFSLLQDKNFNYKKKCGLLVLKFNDYPFVVKLFMEHPNTILNPFVKGFENRVFHFMGHGTNRHTAGATRISNLERLHEILQDKEYQVVLPRKWFWLPCDPKWIEIIGHNIVPNEIISVIIPGTYVIIADELKVNQQYRPVSTPESNEIIMKFCNDVHLIIDPHEDNFIIQKDDKETVIISIVDTEHFPTLVGIPEDTTFVNHLEWYFSLAWKAFVDLFTTSKADHIVAINK